MAKTLVIAEKYLAACDIAKALQCTEKKEGYIEGKDYIITWADGHLIGYKYPEEYNPDYKEWKMTDLPLKFDAESCLKVLPDKEKQFEIVKRLILGEETDLIVNAGDAGREGYLIQHRIYKMAGNKKPVKVLWASATTEEAILEAFANLHDDNEFKYILEEAEARADDDYFKGMNYSRLLTLKCSNDSTLPYGRCMTTLMNLIVQREKEIAEFEPVNRYVVEVEYKNGLKGTIVDLEGKGLVLEDKRDALLIKQELSEATEGIVEKVKGKQVSEKAARPYNLPDLQSVIGKKYKYEPDKTLRIAQKLYEKHILSYPRTDSRALPLSMKESVIRNLESCCFGKFRAAFERAGKDELEADGDYFDDRDIKNVQIKESTSSPPSRYTVGTIIELMEKYHIGTPATMAATIEKLLDEKRPFLVLENGKYYATPFGRMYISVIPEELKDPTLTEQTEWKLQQIREGNLTKAEMLEETYHEFQENLERTDFKKASFERCLKVKKKSRSNYKRKRVRYYE